MFYTASKSKGTTLNKPDRKVALQLKTKIVQRLSSQLCFHYLQRFEFTAGRNLLQVELINCSGTVLGFLLCDAVWLGVSKCCEETSLFRNDGNHSPQNTGLHPRRPEISVTHL